MSPIPKYALVEYEHRFLLGKVPDGLGPSTRIDDRYVSGTRLRLREAVPPDGTRTRKLSHKVRLEEGSTRQVA